MSAAAPLPLPLAGEYCPQTVSRDDAGNGGGEGAFLALIALALLASGCTTNKTLRDDELARIDEWLPGTYDNRPQVNDDMAKNVAEIHAPIDLVILPVSIPIVGEHVFYVESRDSMNPRRVTDQRLYSFESSADKKAIAHTQYRFKEPERWAGTKRNPDVYRSILPDDLSSTSGCQVKWEFDGERFTGVSSAASCRSPAEAGVGSFLELRFELVPNELRMSERSIDASGKVLLGRQTDPLFVFRKTAHDSE